MKKLLFLILFLVCSQAFCADKVVYLVTSIAQPERLPFWYSSDWEITSEIESAYRKSLKSENYELKVFHNVDQYKLHELLTSDEPSAIFFVSHSGKQKQAFLNFGMNLIAIPDVIMDYKNRDITDVFKRINPNIRFISMVGCEGKSIIDKFRDNGFLEENPNLVIHSFSLEMELYKAIRESVFSASKVLSEEKIPRWIPRNKFRKHWNGLPKNKFNFNPHLKIKDEFFTLDNAQCPIHFGYPITIKREIPTQAKEEAIHPIRVMFYGHLVGVLPKGLPGEYQELKTYLPVEPFIRKRRKYKLIVDSGVELQSLQGDVTEEYEMGRISFESHLIDAKWSIFQRRGEPIGITSNIHYLAPSNSQLPDPIKIESMACSGQGLEKTH